MNILTLCCKVKAFYNILNEIALHLLGKHVLTNDNPNRFYILMNTIINHGNGDLPANSQRNILYKSKHICK